MWVVSVGSSSESPRSEGVIGKRNKPRNGEVVRVPTVTGMPASLRTSRVGRVTKPAPSISTLLEAGSPCQPPSGCLSCPRSACGRVWQEVAGGGRMVRAGEGGAVYCCEAILGKEIWRPVAASLCDEVISRFCGEIPASPGRIQSRQRGLIFVFCGLLCRLTH